MYDVNDVVDLIRACEAELDADVKARIWEEFNADQILSILEQGVANEEKAEDAAEKEGTEAPVEE